MTIKSQIVVGERIKASELQAGERIKIWGRYRKVSRVEVRVQLEDSAETHVFSPEYTLELEPKP